MKTGILGYWLEGKSTFNFLTKKQWIDPTTITIFDENPDLILPDWIRWELWINCYQWLKNMDVIRKTPWITNHLLENKLWSKEAFNEIFSKLTSQIQYFFDSYNGYVIWITWTKWKSQTSIVCYQTLQNAWLDVEIVGNIWLPTLDIIDFDSQPEYVVYEISSFMLDSLQEFTLDIWIFITLYSTHTKEHWSYENYVTDKIKLLTHSKLAFIGHQAFESLQTMKNFVEFDDSEFVLFGLYWDYTYVPWDPTWVFFALTEAVFEDSSMLIPWLHNRTNFCCILGVLDVLWLPFKHLEEILGAFSGLEYRTENIWSYHWIQRVNDAIATTPQATIAALDTFWESIETLLYGWIDWEYNHIWVIEKIIEYWITNIVLFPDTGTYIKAGLDEDIYNILETRDMKEAVSFAKEHTVEWKVVLLSCGSPSFSCWSSYKEKWDLFKKYIIE